MSELGSSTQPDDANKSNTNDGKDVEDNKHPLKNEKGSKEGENSKSDEDNKSNSGSKKKKKSKCYSCCCSCCSLSSDDDDLKTKWPHEAPSPDSDEVKEANTEPPPDTTTNRPERSSQTESIAVEAKETSVSSPGSSLGSSASPPFGHFKTPKFWHKQKNNQPEEEQEQSDDLESTSADFKAKLNLQGNEKKELELLERKKSDKDLVKDEDSSVDTLQLHKPEKDKTDDQSDAHPEKSSMDQEQQSFISSDPKNPACFGCKTWK